MIGFKDYLGGLKKVPDEIMGRPHRPETDEPLGRVKNPFHRKSAEKVWGPDEQHYLPKFDANNHGDVYRWKDQPVEELDTSSLHSPQEHLEMSHLDNHPEASLKEPITVTRTKSGQNIIQNGNHRALIAHATTGKIKAHVFQSER